VCDRRRGKASIRLVVRNKADHAERLAQTHIIGQKTASEARGWFMGAEAVDIVFVPKLIDVSNLCLGN
jgi:hypothetical protein